MSVIPAAFDYLPLLSSLIWVANCSDPFTIVSIKGLLVHIIPICHHFWGFIRKINMVYTCEL